MTQDPTAASDTVGELTSQMAQLDQITSRFGATLSRSLATGIAQGKSFDEILRGLGQKLLELSLKSAFSPLESAFSNAINGLVQGVTGAFTGGASPFGSLFGGGTGSGGGSSLYDAFGASAAAAAPVTVNMAVSSPDADSFQRSEAQISAALARAVSRGQRSL